jgi:cyclopropane fatty-acyl-phospholipid synthase-like methyltransferase
MNTSNPIDALFGGMDKLGPGSDRESRHVLGLLPKKKFPVIVDAGCGAGCQTLVLAKELDTPVQAIDSYEPFLNHLKQRAKQMGVEHLETVRGFGYRLLADS